MKPALVAVAGAAGALVRYCLGLAVGQRDFPWVTVSINLIGSFALGLLIKTGQLRGWPEHVTIGLGVGFLGAFTTFSTFSVETQSMLRDGRTTAALVYVTLSLIGGIALAALGYALATARGV